MVWLTVTSNKAIPARSGLVTLAEPGQLVCPPPARVQYIH